MVVIPPLPPVAAGTVTDVFMPCAAWPGTGHQSEYVPDLSVTASVADLPGLIRTVFLVFMPGPAMASSCESLPVFFTTNLTGPAVPFLVEREMWNSFSVTLTVFTVVPDWCVTTPANAAPANAAASAAATRTGRVSFMPDTTEPATRRIGIPSRPPVTLLDRAIVWLLPAVPKPVVQRLSSRYIAGPSLDDAMRVVSRLNAKGKAATVDVLGEEITNADEARAITGQYHDVLARIDEAGLDANVSVKLTGLGLELDLDLCRENLENVVLDAAARGNFVRIDMEDSSTTDRTLELFRSLRADSHKNVGVVLQSYLRRTESDLEGLDNVRLCKGIYIEPEEIAYRDFDEVRASFVRCLEGLVEQGAYVGIATHDEYLIGEALRIVRDLPPERYEFQMLLGVRADRADELVAAGHRLRVYVPYGTHWYQYSVRRLQENPKMAGYVAADLFGRVFRR